MLEHPLTETQNLDLENMSAAALLDVVRFHAECGVDDCLADQPVNHFEKAPTPALVLTDSLTAEKPRRQEAALPQIAVSPVTQVAEADAVAAAKASAQAAGTLAELQTAVEAFPHCSLKRTANATLFASGSENAALVIIGDAPGKDDDRTGDMFSGDEGRLLDAMLRAIGLSKDDVYSLAALPWRPPGNRQPTPAEVAMCAPFLNRHLELVGSKTILSLGALPHRMLTPAEQKPKSVMQLRGTWHEHTVGNASAAVLTTLTPRYLLQQPAHKRLAWMDLLSLQERLSTASS
ncbi:MAG: uracil-DNA glycosylase [Pseudomonadota bacterium]